MTYSSSGTDEYKVVNFCESDPRRTSTGELPYPQDTLENLGGAQKASWIVLEDTKTGQKLTDQICNLPGLWGSLYPKGMEPSRRRLLVPSNFKDTIVTRTNWPKVNYQWIGEGRKRG
jgi:hypothetical protein